MGREKKGRGRGGSREEQRRRGAGRKEQSIKKSEFGFKNTVFKAASIFIIWFTLTSEMIGTVRRLKCSYS